MRYIDPFDPKATSPYVGYLIAAGVILIGIGLLLWRLG